MIKKLFTIFKLGRKLAKSDILNIVSKFKKPPLVIKVLFQILSFSFSRTQKIILIILKEKDYQNHYSRWEQLLLN